MDYCLHKRQTVFLTSKDSLFFTGSRPNPAGFSFSPPCPRTAGGNGDATPISDRDIVPVIPAYRGGNGDATPISDRGFCVKTRAQNEFGFEHGAAESPRPWQNACLNFCARVFTQQYPRQSPVTPPAEKKYLILPFFFGTAYSYEGPTKALFCFTKR